MIFSSHGSLESEKKSPFSNKSKDHREIGGTLGMVPLIINPIYTLYTGYLMVFIGYIPLKGLLGGVKQLGYHLKGTSIFPMKGKMGELIDSFFDPTWMSRTGRIKGDRISGLYPQYTPFISR